MSFFILPGHIATLFIGFKFGLILTFDKPVLDFGGASTGQITVTRKRQFNGQRTVIITAKNKRVDTNFIIFTKDRSYEFYLKYNEARAHDFVKVIPGKINSSYTLKRETKWYRYYEGKSSIKLINKTRKALIVNGRELRKIGYFSKGVPLFIKKRLKFTKRRIFVNGGEIN